MPLPLRAFLPISLLAASSLSAQTTLPPAASPPIVSIKDGQIRGTREDGVLSFKIGRAHV